MRALATATVITLCAGCWWTGQFKTTMKVKEDTITSLDAAAKQSLCKTSTDRKHIIGEIHDIVLTATCEEGTLSFWADEKPTQSSTVMVKCESPLKDNRPLCEGLAKKIMDRASQKQ